MSLYFQNRALERNIFLYRYNLNLLESQANPALDQSISSVFQQNIINYRLLIQDHEIRIAQNNQILLTHSPRQVIDNLLEDVVWFKSLIEQNKACGVSNPIFIQEAFHAQEIIFSKQSELLGQNCNPPLTEQIDPFLLLEERDQFIRLNEQAIAEKLAAFSLNPSSLDHIEASEMNSNLSMGKLEENSSANAVPLPTSGQKRKASTSLENPPLHPNERVRQVRFHPKVEERYLNIRSRMMQPESHQIQLNEKEGGEKKDAGYIGIFYAKPKEYRKKFQICVSKVSRKWQMDSKLKLEEEEQWEELHMKGSKDPIPIWRDEKWGKAQGHEYIVYDRAECRYIAPSNPPKLDDALSKKHIVSRIIEFDKEVFVVLPPDNPGPVPNCISTPQEAQEQGYQIYQITKQSKPAQGPSSD